RRTGAWVVTHFADRQGRPQSAKREHWREQKQRQRRVRAVSARTPAGDNERTDRGVRPLEGEGEEEEEGEVEKDFEGGAGAPSPGTEPAGRLNNGGQAHEPEAAGRLTNGSQPADVPAPLRVFLENGGRYPKGKFVDD